MSKLAGLKQYNVRDGNQQRMKNDNSQGYTGCYAKLLKQKKDAFKTFYRIM